MVNFSDWQEPKMTDAADLESLELSDIIDVATVQSLMDDFYELVPIHMSIFDMQGKPLVGVGWQRICTQFHRANPESCKNCLETGTQLTTGVPAGGYKLFKCKNKMWDAATPLMVDGKHVGNLFVSQFFFDDEQRDCELFRAQARQYGYKQEEYLAALDAVPRVSRQTFQKCMAFLTKLAHMLSAMGYSNLKLARSLAERKQSQEALSKSEELQRRLIDAQMIGCILSNQGQIEVANDTFLAMLGYTREELARGQINAYHFTPPEYHDRLEAAVSRLQATGSCPPFETVNRRKDGTNVPVLVAFAQTDKPGVRIGWVLDISRQKELEAQLLQTQKMEAVGELAGGIAHDFNNLLMAISSHVELLLATVPGNPRVERTASTILTATKHGGQLTRKLLAFSRKQALSITGFNLNDLLAETEELVKHLLPQSIDFRVHHSPAPCLVRADRMLMEQVMVNLVLNARDAMPDGGKLVVSATGVVVREEDAGLHSAVPAGNYGLITVADTGHGIPEHLQRRIFEPFFTTKPKERGTGLGLAMVYGTVTQSGGQVRVKSHVNTGTTLSVYLPTTATPDRRQSDVSCLMLTKEKFCTVHGTVLVVDDEALVRSSVRAFLEERGLRVFDSGNAQEAIRMAEHLGEELSTLITDVIMPDLAGTELARKLLAIRPDLQVVFMSGYAAGTIRLEEFPSANFLQKPFTRETLLGLVCAHCKRQPLVDSPDSRSSSKFLS